MFQVRMEYTDSKPVGAGCPPCPDVTLTIAMVAPPSAPLLVKENHVSFSLFLTLVPRSRG